MKFLSFERIVGLCLFFRDFLFTIFPIETILFSSHLKVPLLGIIQTDFSNNSNYQKTLSNEK